MMTREKMAEILSSYDGTYAGYIETVETPALMAALEDQERLKLLELLFYRLVLLRKLP